MPNLKPLPDLSGVKRYVLKNGAVLLLKEDPTTSVASLNIWVEAGSIDERPDERGMAHLIEHMIFKGTKNRGVGEISRQVESAGGYLNAFTSFEHTCFYVVLPGDQIEKALDIEFDAYLHSTFDKAELEKEKEVVFEEMRMRKDDPWSWSWEILFDSLYRRNPYHWPVIGDMAVLKTVPREKLLQYYKKHYVPSNTVIAVVGNISADKVLSWARKKFEKNHAPRAPKRKFSFDPEPAKLRLRTEAGDVQQFYLSIGFPTGPLAHKDTAALDILESVMGDGAASRLNQVLREKKQLADEIGSDHFTGKFGGAFVFQALTDGVRVEKCLSEFMAQVRDIIQHEIPEAELQKVKNKITASKVFEKQNVDGQAKTLGFWELQGGYQMDEKYLETLGRVTSREVQDAAQKYLRPERATLVLYHPKAQKTNSSPVYWQRLLQSGLESPPKMKSPAHSSKSLQKFRLQNGAALWVKPRKGLPLNSLGVFIKGGFSQEDKKSYGITNLMAKCLSKGTQSKNSESFSVEVENLAAHLDPMMEKDYWGIVLDVLKPNFEKAFGLLKEALWEPRFEESEVAKEKKLQMASIKRLKDDPSEFAMLESDLITFAGTAYAHRPMGSLETVGKITRKALLDWHKGFSNPAAMTWVAVGDYDGQELKNFLDSKLPQGRRKAAPPAKIVKKTVLKSASLVLKSENQQANLVLGLQAPVFFGQDYFAFRVLNTVLSGMGGRLFVELREKKSLAYSVFGAHDAGIQAGIYQIYVGCAPGKISEAKRELLKVLQSISTGNVLSEEVQRAKTYMTGLFQLGLQTNRSQVHSFARYELTGPGARWVDQFCARIRKVTPQEVQRAAKKYLETEHKTWVLLTPGVKGDKNVRLG